MQLSLIKNNNFQIKKKEKETNFLLSLIDIS
jgi:hypothetical protein